MLICARLACCLLVALTSVHAAIFETTIQPLAGEKPAAGRYSAYVPDGVAKIRAIIFHQHGCGGIQAVEMVYDQQWRALADKWDALLLGDDLDDACVNWYQPTDGSKAMQERAFAYFASQSGHPEISTAPICLWGHSGGGDWTIEFVQRYPEKVIAVYARSGGHDPGAIANGVPILFSHGWPSSNDYNYDYADVVTAGRSRGAPWAWMIDPGGSHDCSNGRYVAIPYFDACMAVRLPTPPVNAEAVTLRTITFTDGWTGLSAKAQMGQAGWGGVSAATSAQSTDATRSWLPSQDVAQRWSQFVTSGNGGQNMGGVSDASPPEEAPHAVVAAVSGSDVTLSWLARADLQGGIRRFKIYRDNLEVFSLGNWFQGHGFGDEPQPTAPAMSWSDTGVSNGLHWYEVATVNGSDVVGPRSARIPVFIGPVSDTTAPTISITTPAASAGTSATSPIALAGVAADNIGIASVVWANDRGGSGTATGTTNWSVPAVPLKSGTNIIRVTAYDAVNHATSASVTVVSSTTAIGGEPSAGDSESSDSSSSCGLGSAFSVSMLMLGLGLICGLRFLRR